MNSEQKTLEIIVFFEPATQGDLPFGRGESLSGGSEGATWEQVRKESGAKSGEEVGSGGVERRRGSGGGGAEVGSGGEGAEEGERAISTAQRAILRTR